MTGEEAVESLPVKARLKLPRVLPIATTSARFAGTLACPLPLYPQAMTSPLDLRARLWLSPQAIATTSFKPPGTVV